MTRWSRVTALLGACLAGLAVFLWLRPDGKAGSTDHRETSSRAGLSQPSSAASDDFPREAKARAPSTSGWTDASGRRAAVTGPTHGMGESGLLRRAERVATFQTSAGLAETVAEALRERSALDLAFVRQAMSACVLASAPHPVETRDPAASPRAEALAELRRRCTGVTGTDLTQWARALRAAESELGLSGSQISAWPSARINEVASRPDVYAAVILQAGLWEAPWLLEGTSAQGLAPVASQSVLLAALCRVGLNCNEQVLWAQELCVDRGACTGSLADRARSLALERGEISAGQWESRIEEVTSAIRAGRLGRAHR